MLHRRFIHSLAAALAATAVLAPSAVARTADHQVGSPPAATQAAPAAEAVHVPGPTVVVEADESAGFDWGSAGVGAAIVAAVALLAGTGASSTVRHRGAVTR